jgi:hypothetical protein
VPRLLVPRARIKWLCSGIMLPVFYAQRRCAPLPVTTPLPRHRPSAYEPKSCSRFARPCTPARVRAATPVPAWPLPRLRARALSRRHAGRSCCAGDSSAQGAHARALWALQGAEFSISRRVCYHLPGCVFRLLLFTRNANATCPSEDTDFVPYAGKPNFYTLPFQHLIHCM